MDPTTLAARLVGPPFGLDVLDGDRPILGPPDGGGLAFQTTTSVGARRWRHGPAQWEPGPANVDPPPDHGWHHATGVIGQDGDRTVLATDDPEERRLVVELTITADEVTLVAAPTDPGGVEAVSCAFAAGPAERWLGFGERADEVVRAAGVVEHYVADGPWQEWEYPFLPGTVPPWAIRRRPDATYFPVPWVLSTAGVGVAVANDDVSYARLRPGGAPWWSIEVEAPALTVRVFPGPSPLDALRRYTERVGRQAEPEPWWWGPWYQTGHANHVQIEEERSQLARLRAARAPVSAVETHCRYLPVGEHRGHRDEEVARVEHLHEAGLAVLSYLNPLISVDFPEAYGPADRDGALLRRADGSTYTFDAYAGGREPPVTQETHYDLTGSTAAGHWQAVAAELVAAGYDGWMEDFGEYTPLDAVLAATGELAGTAGHDRYVTDYHAAATEVTARLEARSGRRLARFVRSGWTGTAAVAPIVWGGDPTTSWGFNGLASAVREGLSAGASGVALWGSDIGGFVSSVDHLTVELLLRWIGFGACSPVMRTKAGGIQGPDVVRPQIWDDDVIAVWARWAAWHTQLQPYLAAAHATYRRTGRPVMAAHALVDPGDEGGLDRDDQYLLGPDLVVAPVLEDGARTRSLYVPPGRWVDLWRSARYDTDSRATTLTGRASELAGAGHATIAAPLDEVPVLLRAGAVLPLLSAEVDSLSPYRVEGIVNVADRDDIRHLLCVPDEGTWSGQIGVDEPVVSRVDEHGWALDLEGARRRCYQVQADLSLLSRPAQVVVGGAAEGWRYDPATGVLDAEVSGSSLTVRWGER